MRVLSSLARCLLFLGNKPASLQDDLRQDENDVNQRLGSLEDRVAYLEKQEKHTMATIHDLIQSTVEDNARMTNAVQSVKTLLATLQSTIKTATDRAVSDGDMTLLQDLHTTLGQNIDALTEATLANTPAAADSGTVANTPAAAPSVDPTTVTPSTQTPPADAAPATPATDTPAPASEATPSTPESTPAPAAEQTPTTDGASPGTGATPTT